MCKFGFLSGELVKWCLVEFVVGNEPFYVFEIGIYQVFLLTFNKYLYRKRIICLKRLTKYNLPNIVCLC